MFDGCLPEVVRLGSADATGELLWGPENLRKFPGLASVARVRDCSPSLPAITSRLLETAARLADPLERPKKVKLDNYMQISFKVRSMRNNEVLSQSKVEKT